MLCCRCKQEERAPGQRWGRACFAAYQREWQREERRRARELRLLERGEPDALARLLAKHGVRAGNSEAHRGRRPGRLPQT